MYLQNIIFILRYHICNSIQYNSIQMKINPPNTVQYHSKHHILLCQQNNDDKKRQASKHVLHYIQYTNNCSNPNLIPCLFFPCPFSITSAVELYSSQV